MLAATNYARSVLQAHVRLSPGDAPPCRLPIADATYYANAHVLLHDDTCFRFAYKRNDTATIQMMDPDKTEVSPGALAFALPCRCR